MSILVTDLFTYLQFLSKERSHGVSNTKGQLHLFGSTEFATQFTAHWQREGYCDYTAPPVVTSLTGTNVSPFVCLHAFIAL